jgi:hypothetical protein
MFPTSTVLVAIQSDGWKTTQKNVPAGMGVVLT